MIPCWLLGHYFFSKCTHAIYFSLYSCTVSSVCYQANRSRTSRTLFWEKWVASSLSHLLCSMWFFNNYQQCFSHCVCKFSQSQDIQHLGLESWPHLMMRDALPDRSDQKLLPLVTKMGEIQEAGISFFSLFQGPHRHMCGIPLPLSCASPIPFC